MYDSVAKSHFYQDARSLIPRVSFPVPTDPLLYSRLLVYSLLTAQHVFYVPSKGEPADDEELKAYILDPITRHVAAHRPNVTDLAGIRSHFCFRAKDEHTIYMRVHSCHCEVCLSQDWLQCDNEDAGSWEEMPLHATAAAVQATTRALTAQQVLGSR
jgi:hypothetical protein